MTETPPTASIVVETVARAFGEVHAVRDASFVAGPGTVTALIGPNGSGKTTLLLILASLVKSDTGSIRIAGFDPITDTAAVRSLLGCSWCSQTRSSRHPPQSPSMTRELRLGR